MEKQKSGISKTKDFRYPPVLPIVFYDGVENWTAAVRLHERVLLSDVLGEYIPNYQCILMQSKEYSNAELMKREDILSVVFMLTNLHRTSDFVQIEREVSSEYLEKVMKDAPEYLLSIVAQITGVLLSRINVPEEEIDRFSEQIKERRMGKLFENFETYDVQETRRVAREEGIRKGIEYGVEQGIEQGIEQGVRNLVRTNKKHEISKDETISDLMELYNMSGEEANKRVELFR